MKNRLILFVFCLLFIQNTIADNALKLHYTFSSGNNKVEDISGNGYDGTLNNNAEQKNYGNQTVLDLGYRNGYVDMGAKTGELIKSLEDFTIATCLYIDPEVNISGNGNFVWAFSTREFCNANEGKYIAYRVNRQRYALSTGGWNREVCAIEKGWTATQGSWQHVVYTQSNSIGAIYLNGTLYATGEALLTPKNIGEATVYNWIGKPHFSGDAYLQGAMLSDFRIYNRALAAGEIVELSKNLPELNRVLAEKKINEAKNKLELTGLSDVRTDINLPYLIDGVTITWKSSNASVISDRGVVTRPASGSSAQEVFLTATLTKDGVSGTKVFITMVTPYFSDKESVDTDAEKIVIHTGSCLKQNIYLPVKGIEGSDITWQSDHPEYLSAGGKIVSLPAKEVGRVEIILTATITKGSEFAEKRYTVCVAEDEGFSAYLFAYFTGNSGQEEAIRFALSLDAYNYKALNNNNPILDSDTISNMKGVRDPHILRGEDGNYYMVVTDMKSAWGWDSNHGIVLLKSPDLIHWKASKIDIKATYPGRFGNIQSAWAPQTIYDSETGKYMIYWSMRSPGIHEIIYYSYANSDFTGLENEPEILFSHPNSKSTIDGDIIYRDGQYYLFFKTEGDGNGIKQAVSGKLTEGYVLRDKYLQQTTQAVEGSCVFRLINSDTYILMYDVYNNGRYEFTESTDLMNFSKIEDGKISMDFHPRHGTVIPITEEEKERLIHKWGQSLSAEIENANVNTLTVFPNPAVFTININGFESGSLSIYNSVGVKVLDRKTVVENETININELPDGIYFVTLVDKYNNLYYNKLIKK